MQKADVLVIGGSAAGIVTAVTGKMTYPEKDFVLIRKEEKVLVPCGIPYTLHSLSGTDKNLIPDGAVTSAGIELVVDEVISIDKENKCVKTASGKEFSYEKLVLATGSIPKFPGWLKGTDLQNVFTVPKDCKRLDEMLNTISNLDKIVVVGGGFIGVEVSDELVKMGKDVTIIEILPHLLSLVFDEEVALKAEEVLADTGLKILTGSGVKEIMGQGKVEGVSLDNGETMEADGVILSIGYAPNTELAQKAGIALNRKGFIKVDEYMRTMDRDILAVGDCAEKRDFVTRKSSSIMLASTACAEARIAGMNLFQLSSIKTFSGTIAIFSTAFRGTGFGCAGLTENMAKKEGFEIVTGTFEGVDHHPGTLEGTHKQRVKLIASKDSGVILGGEVVGGMSTGEIVNIIGFAIQNRMTVNAILTAQIGTHPLLTAPPTAYPLIKTAECITRKMKE